MANNRAKLKSLFVNGDYSNLKEFAEKRGLSYSYIQQLSAKDNWMTEKVRVDEEKAKKIGEEIQKQQFTRSVEEFVASQNTSLEFYQLAKKKALELLQNADAKSKDVNALVLAIKNADEGIKDIYGNLNPEQAKDFAKIEDDIADTLGD